ncbi:MAG: hypothetical protein WC841_05350 [Candidatus Shapirobacteria bacterium]|jgi:hypothetical protein
MKRSQLSLIIILFILIFTNLTVYFCRDPYTRNRLALFSLSKGDRYAAHLNLWRLYIDNRRWDLAQSQEFYLDQSDLADYKAKNDPEEFKKQLNSLVVKPDKTVEDYMEMAKLQHCLNKISDAQNSLLLAKNADPVRDDLINLFFDSQPR